MTKEDILRSRIPTIDDLPTLFRPANGWMMVKNLPTQGESEGGIILPEISKINYTEGHIVAVANDQLSSHHGFNMGDCVTWSPSSAYEFATGDGVKFSLVKPQDVLMYIPREKLVLESKFERPEKPKSERRDK